MNKVKGIGMMLCVGIAFFACNKTDIEISDNVQEQENQNLSAELESMGYYHNLILSDLAENFDTSDPAEHEAMYNWTCDLAADFTGEEVGINYEDAVGYLDNYLPFYGMTIEEIEESELTTPLSVTANHLFEDELISENELAYHELFETSILATEDFEEANTVILSLISDVQEDEALSSTERDAITNCMDVGLNSLNFWQSEFDLGAESDWVVPNASRDRPGWRKFWRAVKLMVADYAGAAVGVGMGTLFLGPFGGFVAGQALSAYSSSMADR